MSFLSVRLKIHVNRENFTKKTKKDLFSFDYVVL